MTVMSSVSPAAAADRVAEVQRNTAETQISVRINLDGSGAAKLSTGIGFFDHMLDQIARHGLIDLDIQAQGDLHIDGHHTVEDVGITLGQAFAQAVGDKIEVWMDGGIRSGQDVLKAWALGAKGTLIGRPFLYGLGAMGGPGVTKCLEIIHKELDLTMAFTGHRDIQDVTKDILYPGTY